MMVVIGERIFNLALCREIKLRVQAGTLIGMTLYYQSNDKRELDAVEAGVVYKRLMASQGAPAEGRVASAAKRFRARLMALLGSKEQRC
jgi:hypothetical protein